MPDLTPLRDLALIGCAVWLTVEIGARTYAYLRHRREDALIRGCGEVHLPESWRSDDVEVLRGRLGRVQDRTMGRYPKGNGRAA